MRTSFFLIAVQLLAVSATVVKRATVNDVATVGYATLNGGTTGGSGGPTTTVTTLDALTTALTGSAKKIVLISGTITGNVALRVGSNTTVIGKTGSALVGVGLRVFREQNVIIRNVKISKVLAKAGDAIGVQEAHQVWIDHVDLSSDLDHSKDFYDGLCDLTHGVTGITVTNSFLHEHFKASLIGHSDNNGAEDTAITVTMGNNYWRNLNSRTPSLRFGHGHVFNNVFDSNILTNINTREGACRWDNWKTRKHLITSDSGAQMLIQNNVFINTSLAIESTDTGFAVATGNDFGGATNTAPVGTFTSPPYSFTLLDTASVKAAVVGTAGQTLSF
ncbi:unnamed protein product [Mycena citricolor]|uniref:Pectate lyase domain-containing protein n=1 Tax=Mycena citricolor TaxID=2018698 RepID=A0AAD2HXZ6_9AGAR|nr:unnamed protein product [Mycena citricolor]